jgi:Ca-activated chloride channel homolog
MLILTYRWVLLLLPLPWLIHRFAPEHREKRQGLVVPFLDRLARQAGRKPTEDAVVMTGGWVRTISMVIFWICTVLTLARPQWIEPPVVKNVPVRDILLAVDLSGSMDTKDFTDSHGKKVDRLTAVKEVLDDFLSRREGDRVGLIFFGTAPFVQAPFTEDLKLCRTLLDEAQVRMAGPQTAFGDAIGLAIDLFERSTNKERVLIALTDGNDTNSKIPPTEAAQIAMQKGIVIDTVAVGDPRAAGEEALDVDSLKKVASTTGGIYSFAADRAQLARIYDKLDKLETHKAETISYRPRRDVYYWPLAVGLVTTLFQHLVSIAVADAKRILRRRNARDSTVKEAPAHPLPA